MPYETESCAAVGSCADDFEFLELFLPCILSLFLIENYKYIRFSGYFKKNLIKLLQFLFSYAIIFNIVNNSITFLRVKEVQRNGKMRDLR